MLKLLTRERATHLALHPASLGSPAHWSWTNEEQALAGGSLPNLCFPHNVSSPLCNHSPVQRKTILDNRELNLDFSCVSVWGEQSIPDKCHKGGSAACVCSVTAKYWDRGQAALPCLLHLGSVWGREITSAFSYWHANEARLLIRKARLLTQMTAACGFHAADGSSMPNGAHVYVKA